MTDQGHGKIAFEEKVWPRRNLNKGICVVPLDVDDAANYGGNRNENQTARQIKKGSYAQPFGQKSRPTRAKKRSAYRNCQS